MSTWAKKQLLYVSGSIGISGSDVIVKFEGNSKKGYCGVRKGGLFIIAGLSSGVYTLTPESKDYTFSPAFQVISLTGDNIPGIIFIPTPI